MTPLAIPYPSEIVTPYILEPIGQFFNAWGPPVIYPLAHWAAGIAITLSFIGLFRFIWWDISTGGPQNRAQAAIARTHMEAERQRQIRERSGGLSG